MFINIVIVLAQKKKHTAEMENNSHPLNLCHVQKPLLIFNRFHTFLHGSAIVALVYYRATSLYKTQHKMLLPNALVFASELILCFLWFLGQAYRWRPVKRTVIPERLPEDDELPAIDVFVCTADPRKEPSLEVMNTVISSMALDYPPEKLHVYLSDDGGSTVTRKAMREAWRFTRGWLPFCRKYGVRTRCPEAYFSRPDEFNSDSDKMKEEYEVFKERVEWIRKNTSMDSSKDHPATIEVINGGDDDQVDAEETMPLTVYVSREKRISQFHHFKAGALNVLLRVSSMLSNSPYILVLDCDMYCNDSSSARQAMCFHLDPRKDSRLAWVQFPQKFHNVSDNDIYDSQIRNIFGTCWPGKDGLGGPTVSGTGVFITRESLFGSGTIGKDVDVGKLRKTFGPSLEFIKTIEQNNAIDHAQNVEKRTTSSFQEIELLASSAFENNTQWGKEVGFRYFSVVEDYFTGFSLHCKGYISVFHDPPNPAFLGSGTTNLSELLVQNTRWATGLVEVGVSKYSPLIYGPPRMSLLLSMCYAELASLSFFCIPLWCLAVVPQLALIRGISLYPEISSPFCMVFVFIFISSNLKHIQEVLSSGLPIQSWLYEVRMWMIKSVTCYTFGTLRAFMEKIGMKEASFLPTNKVAHEGQLERYQAGIYDFQVPTMFISPICTLIIVNFSSLVIGGVQIFRDRNFGEMAIQAFIPLLVVVVQYPVIEGMFFRKDSGRVPHSAAVLSSAMALVIMSLGVS